MDQDMDPDQEMEPASMKTAHIPESDLPMEPDSLMVPERGMKVAAGPDFTGMEEVIAPERVYRSPFSLLSTPFFVSHCLMVTLTVSSDTLQVPEFPCLKPEYAYPCSQYAGDKPSGRYQFKPEETG